MSAKRSHASRKPRNTRAKTATKPARFDAADRAELREKVAKKPPERLRNGETVTDLTLSEAMKLVDTWRAAQAEPTFTLSEIVGVFGSNYDVRHYTPLARLALEAMDDAMRTIMVAYEALDVLGDDSDTGNALYNAKCRLEVAQNLLIKLPGVKLDCYAAEAVQS